MRIDLAPSSGLDLTVVNERGSPLEADVLLWNGQLASLRRERSDARGALRLEQLPTEQELILLAKAPGHRHAWHALELKPGERRAHTLTLAELKPESFSGLVLDQSYRPVAQVSVLTSALSARARPSNRIKSAADGTFALALGEAPPSSLSVELVSTAHASLEATLRPGEEALLVLPPGGSIAGQVISSRGRPVSNYTLSVIDFRPERGQRVHPLAAFPSASFEAADGRFTFGPLRPGTYYLRAQPGEELAAADSQAIRVLSARTTSNITLSVSTPGRIRGEVVDATTGRPIEGASVQLSEPGVSGSAATRTDAAGQFALEGVSPGRKSLRVSLQGYTTQVAAGIEVAPDSNVTQRVSLSPGDEKRGFSFYGIGAAIGQDDQGLFISSVIQGGPALKTGVKSDDRLISIDGTSTQGMRLVDAVERIRGQEGEPVRLDLEREGQGRLTLSVERGQVDTRR